MSASHTPTRPRPTLRRAVTTTVVGNFVEYFDWLAYGLLAPLFAKQFFPSAGPVTSLLGVFAVFAAGMFFRPLGAILLGRLADRHGRKPALVLSIALMAGGSILIGIAPTYESVGLFAALILLIARCAQGMSSGGESPAAFTYLMEMAPAHRKCFYGSLFPMSASAGGFAVSLLAGALTSRLGSQAMKDWGWRIPFLVGGVLGILLLIARHRLAETAVFEREVRSKPARGSLRRVLGRYRRQVVLVVLMVAGLNAVMGTWTAVVPAMGHRIAPDGVMFWVIVVINGVGILIVPPLGLLADRIGPLRFLTIVSIAFALAAPYAYLAKIGEFGFLAFAYGSGWLFMGCVFAVVPLLLTGMFPAEIRTLGVGVPYGLTTALIGGSAPYLATYLDKNGGSGWYIGAIVLAVLAGAVAAAIADRRFTIAPPATPSAATGPGLTSVAGSH